MSTCSHWKCATCPSSGILCFGNGCTHGSCLSVSTSDVYTHRHAALSIHDWAQEHGCKRVMLGHQDTGTIVVSGMTAAYLGWSQLSHVTQCHWADQHWVCRVFPDNGIYRIAADTPVVMTISSRICTAYTDNPRYTEAIDTNDVDKSAYIARKSAFAGGEGAIFCQAQ